MPPPIFDLERHDEQRLQAAERSYGAEVKQAEAAGDPGTAAAAIRLMYSDHLRHATSWPKKAADKYAAEYPKLHAIDSLLQWAHYYLLQTDLTSYLDLHAREEKRCLDAGHPPASPASTEYL